MPIQKPTKQDFISLRVPAGMSARLDACAEKTGMPRATIAIAAIEAVLAAVEREGGVFMPVKMRVDGSNTDPISRGKAIVRTLAQFHAPTTPNRNTTPNRKDVHLHEEG